MNFFNRAVKNVTRKLSKTILLMLTFFMIGNFVIVGLSVSNAAESAKLLTRKKMRAVVTLSVDYNKVWEYVDSLEDEDAQNEFYKNYPSVTVKDVKDLLIDERVKTANATSVDTAHLLPDSGIDYVHLNNNAESYMSSAGQSCWTDSDGNSSCSMYIEPTVAIKSNYFPNMIEFEDGQYVITSGRMYNEEEIEEGTPVCLVTEEFAEANRLSVGDKLPVMFRQPGGNDYSGFKYTNEEATMYLEVIGIYSHTNKVMPDSNNFDNVYPYDNPDNLILIPGNTYNVQSITFQQKLWDFYKEKYPDDSYYTDPTNYPSLEKVLNNNLGEVTLLLNDPLEVENFVEDYENSVGQFIKLDANNDEFKRLSKPLDTLSLYSNFIVWLVVINAIVIITLVTALTLKTREYEIGVLLSIGASKFKVIAQFFVELALVAIVGFTLAVGTGSLVANKVGAKVLDYQINESGVNENDDDNYFGWDDYSVWNTNYTTEVSLDDLISEYDASVSPVIIGEIYVMGLGIVLISVLIPSIMIMRYNPKKILMGMN